MVGVAIAGAGILGAGAQIYGAQSAANAQENAANQRRELYPAGLSAQQFPERPGRGGWGDSVDLRHVVRT